MSRHARHLVVLATATFIVLSPGGYSSCLLSSSGENGIWPAEHPLLDTSAWNSRPVAKVVTRACATELDHVAGVFYSNLPPSHALLFGNGTAVELPNICCQHAQEPQTRHKVVPELWQLAKFVAEGSAAGERCDPRISPSHSCPKFHPSSSVPLVAFEVHLAPAHALLQLNTCHKPSCRAEQQREFAESAAIDWQPAITQELGADVIIEPVDGFLVFYVPSAKLEDAVTLVARQPLVASITPARTHFLHNLREVSLLMQTTQLNADSAVASDTDLQFWDAGLNGQGQIIGLGDGGIDMRHCAFSDPEVPFENFKVGDERVPYFESENHRKVSLYFMYGDAVDDAVGHGTHVASIAAGDPPGSSNKNLGAAPGAKIAFFDLGSSADHTVTTPYDLEAEYFSITYAANARVHAASWGSNAVHYDSDCVAVDRFAASHPDFLPVFSAGNFGSHTDAYNTTVNAPALAKNTIAVGNALPAGHEYALPTLPAAETHLLSFSVLELPMLDAVVAAADFGGSWQDIGQFGIPLVAANPIQACSEVQSATPATGKIVLVERGGCDFDSKVDAIALAGAAGVIVGNTANEFMVVHRTTPSSSSIPVASVPQSSFKLLLSLLASGREVMAQYKGKYNMAEFPSYESMDFSSSQGPTLDGRVKPDLVATGTVQAAQSDTGCGVSVKSGTSMAAPVVAAAAAVVRQYFSDGFYPTGVAEKGPSHEASGPLVKAVLIGGATTMKGFSGAAALPMAAPSPVQGWGHVNLASSLPLNGGDTVKNMQVVDLAAFSGQGKSHVYCIDAQGGTLSVTLVWHDPAGSPAAEQQLVNDLDLDVKLAALGGLKLHSQGAATPDRVNNVERIVLQSAPAGHVAITVKAHSLSTTTQQYSLVVLGSFSGVLNHEQNPALEGGRQTQEGECVIQAAELTIKPRPLTAEKDTAFAFQGASGVAPVAGFECKLHSLDASEDVLHDWTTCSSPKQYSGLSDGLFTFSVRINGEEVAESYDFEVDISPPETSILQNFGYNSSSPLAISLPPASSGQQVVAFAVGVTDRSEVKLTCQLSGTGDTAPLSYAPGFALNKEYACTSPQVFSITSAGEFNFSVTGTDAVGNFQQDPVTHSFNVTYADGGIYTVIDTPSWGLTNNRTHELSLKAVTGTPDGPGMFLAAAQEFQVSVANLSGTLPQQALQWLATSWADVNGSAYLLQAPNDGEYELRVRAQSSTLERPVTSWRLTIDSTPPKVTFLAAPPEVMLSDVVVMRVKADEEDVQWQCALLDGDFEAVSTELLKPSCNISNDGTIEYGGLQDGSMFTSAVRAVDRVGNASPIHVHRFLVDLSAPEVRAMQFLNATRENHAEFVFGVDDGAAGTGVAAVICGVRWLGNGAAGDTDWVDCEDADSPAHPVEECDGCEWYMHRIEAQEEGMWGLSVRTRDLLNQTQVSNEAVVVIDRHAPEATWEQSKAPRNPSPPSFTLHVQALDTGPYKSGLNGALCAVQKFGTEPDDDFELQRGADVVLDAERGDRERGYSSFAFLDTLGNVQDGHLGTWHHCSLPVKLQSVPSGNYDCFVKPLDWAGNAADALTMPVTVDEGLAPHSSVTVGGERQHMKAWQAGLVASAAVTVLLAVACFAVWSSRRRRRQVSESHVQHLYEASTSHGWSAELSADLRSAEQDRIQRALDESLLSAGLDASKAQRRHEKAMQLAAQPSRELRAENSS